MSTTQRKTALDYSCAKLWKLKGHATGIIVDTKRHKLSQTEYLARRKALTESTLFQKSPFWVQREIMAFMDGAIQAFNMFDIVFVYTLPDGNTYAVHTPEYRAAVDYSTIKQWDHTGRLVWKDDFSKVWF